VYVLVSQHTPVVHCGTTHEPPEHPYGQSVHHAALPSVSHTCDVPQFAIVTHDGFVVAPSQPALVPLQYRCTVRYRASDPQSVPEHPYSSHESHTCVVGANTPALQHTPVEHCCAPHSPL